jgi:putative intracellular protease/amidase
MTKVLIVLTGAKEWVLKDGSKHFGGVWSPEFVYPHDCFTKAGYEVVVATLGGVPAPVDPASLSLVLQENDQASVDFQRGYPGRRGSVFFFGQVLDRLNKGGRNAGRDFHSSIGSRCTAPGTNGLAKQPVRPVHPE